MVEEIIRVRDQCAQKELRMEEREIAEQIPNQPKHTTQYHRIAKNLEPDIKKSW